MNAMEKKGKTMTNSRQPGSGGHNGSSHRSVHAHAHAHAQGSFHKKAAPPPSPLMRRPKTHPELLNREKPPVERTPWLNLEAPPRFGLKAPPAEPKTAGKLLVNVTVSQSIGALRVLVTENATVLEVIKTAVDLYAKEGRRPVLSKDPLAFDLHYSQFCIDCLNSADKIKELGSRNFFLCPKVCADAAKENGGSCGSEMEKHSIAKEPWYKLMDCFLLLL